MRIDEGSRLDDEKLFPLRIQVLLYVVPVVLLSVGVNLSRWFELELQEIEIEQPSALDEGEEGGGNETEKLVVVGIAGTWLRYNQVRSKK